VQKKQRLVQIKPDETNIHPVGQERFVSVRNYVGDLPTGEPNDWFEAPEELYDPSDTDELLEDEWLFDEY